MESEGVRRIFGRSIQKHNLRYTPFVGDGDSKSYSEVVQLSPYGPAFYIPKEDCISHVTKRMGTALRKLQKELKGITHKNLCCELISNIKYSFSDTIQYIVHSHKP